MGAPRCICGCDQFARVFDYSAPPEGEVRFRFTASIEYRRAIYRCTVCGHFLSTHDMNMAEMYNGEYVDATYGGDGIRRAFDRIVSLDPSQSDNAGRVRRIVEFGNEFFGARNGRRSILDIGSGLCVFLNGMKAAGWACTALDPDTRSVFHARDTVGIDAICGDFMELDQLAYFDVITFNKVLEHVEDPISMLAKARKHLNSPAFVYVELPDGEMAVRDGAGREEFFIDHWHIFSAASVAVLSARAGFSIVALERLREPSGKYTLRSFLIPSA